MSIIDKLKQNSKSKYASAMDSSNILLKDHIDTGVPMLNLVLSGKMDGGISRGHTAFAGPSKHFKTSFALTIASAYLKAYEDSSILFYDSEFSPADYFTKFGIDTSKVLHTPVETVEGLKEDISNQLDQIERDDKVFILIDSLSNIASTKEIEDALDGKVVADMTRAKAIKSLFRMITPKISIKDLPLVTINHTYETMDFYSKQIVSGGKGVVYSADTILIVGRQQEKEGTDLIGYNFILNVEKSRFIKEGSKIPINVTWEGGINKWSGLLDVALEGNYVVKPKKGWYIQCDGETGEVLGEKNYRAKETNSDEFWDVIFQKTNFKEYVENKFKI